MYSLTSENLTHLGGPMGSEYTTTNWRKYFETLEEAKEYAEKDYNGKEKIKWSGSNKIHSQDLLFVMYQIEEIIPIKENKNVS